MTNVLLAETPDGLHRDLDIEQTVLGDGATITRTELDVLDDAGIAACRAADVVLTEIAPLPDSTIAHLENCRLISVVGTGYNNVDIDAAKAAGISVCAVDDYCSDEVADHAVMLMLALCRRLRAYDELVQTQRRWQFDAYSGLQRLRGLTLGVIGFGKIGQAVARRAKGFGMRVIASDNFPNQGAFEDAGAELCDLDTLLRESDIISVNCSVSADNAGFLNREAFSKMARRPIFINCSRGELVDESALVEALDSGQVAAAGLDVLSVEPPDLSESPFVDRDNVILTPHIAFYSDTALVAVRQISAENVLHHLNGRHDLVRKYVHDASGENRSK